MSLYWQQALTNRDQNSGQDQAAQSQWDYVNLGGAPSIPYQWGQYNENSNSNGSTAQADPYANAVYSGYNQYAGNAEYANQHTGEYASNAYMNNYTAQSEQGAFQAQQDPPPVQHAPILSNTLVSNNREPRSSIQPYCANQLFAIQEHQEQSSPPSSYAVTGPSGYNNQANNTEHYSEPVSPIYTPVVLTTTSDVPTSQQPDYSQGYVESNQYVLPSGQPFNTACYSSTEPTEPLSLSSIAEHVSLPDTCVRPHDTFLECVPSESVDSNSVVILQDQESSSDGQQSIVVTEDAPNLESSCNTSQVTPESTYSVDTFASKDDDSALNNKDDTWDDWDRTDRSDTLHETSSIASVTQSEPVCQESTNLFTDNSRESSVAPQSSNNWSRESSIPPVSNIVKQEEPDRAVETQPAVAQVAPLVKKTSVEPVDQPIARVEPVTQAFDSPSNVQRVAPTRPITNATPAVNTVEAVRTAPAAVVESVPRQPSVPVVESVPRQPSVPVVESLPRQQSVPVAETVPISNLTPVVETTSAVNNRPVSSSESIPLPVQPIESVTTVEAEISVPVPAVNAMAAVLPTINSAPEPVQNEHPIEASEEVHVAESAEQVPNSVAELVPPPQNENAITPEPATPLETESPGVAQATSTPLSEQDISRNLSRRNSTASTRGVPQSQTMPQLSGEQSDSTQSSFTRNAVRGSYHERYRGVKEKYLGTVHNVPQVIQRLDRYRVETPRLKKNPLVDMSVSGRRSALAFGTASATPAATRPDTSIDNSMGKNEMDRMNSSMYSQQDNSLNQSVDISRNNIGYGDDFVNAARRSRLSRNRPPSRAKSEVGEAPPHPHAHPQNRHYPYNNYNPHMMHPSHYPGYMHPGRRSAVPYGSDFYSQPQRMYQDYNRPQSTVDTRAMQRFQHEGGNYATYDAYDYPPEEEEEGSYESDSVDDEDETGESEVEMRQYNAPASMSSYSMQAMAPRHPEYHRWHPKLTFYLGMLRLDPKLVELVFRRLQPPMEYYTILTQPHEQAAYLYYATVNKKLYEDIKSFQNKFNKEFYKLKYEGVNDNDALCRICRAMYDQYHLTRLTNKQKAYEASQKQLFSDDRDSADGVSDRASVDEKEDDIQSDILSVDTRAPLKFRTPHAFVTFGPGGKMITVQPELSVSTVHIDDVKKVLKDNESKRLIDAAQMFRGPLIVGKTPSHSVLLYIERQISKIKMSDVATQNPQDNDVVDCLLVWQLLEMLVQQQGRVTGPDIAKLLIAAGSSYGRASVTRDKSTTPASAKPASSGWEEISNPNGFDKFSQFLLRGHVEEAIECALQDGLYADAMALTRRLFPGDIRKLSDIETRFLSTRPATNPVMTLMAVSSGQPAPILSNPPVDDTGSWRTHAAIVLANLDTDHARHTVHGLGLVLAKREYHAAADFCLLAVALLSNADVFQPAQNCEGDARTHISLIHASLPDDDWESTQCRYGFSLTDLHATEIFDYALKLAHRESPLQRSLNYQRKRLQYAQLLASFGGFTTDSFRYCLSVASSIWQYYYNLTAEELTELADLADRLRYSASAEADEVEWIENLRQLILQMPQSSGQQYYNQTISQTYEGQYYDNSATVQEQGTEVASAPVSQNYYQEPTPEPVEQEAVTSPLSPAFNSNSSPRDRAASISSTRSKAESLVVEANDWHSSRQDPIQITPKSPVQAPLNTATTPANNESYMQDYTTPRERSDSFNPSSYGEQLCRNQQQAFSSYDPYSSSQYDQESSEQTNTPESLTQESTPVRQIPNHNEYAAQYADMLPHPGMPNQVPPQQFQQPPMPTPAPVPAAPVPSASTVPPAASNPPQQQPAPSTSSKAADKLPDQNKKSGRGFIGKLLSKVIPDQNSMILPDDKNPSIMWDANLNKWVGTGVEEEAAAAAPPPSVMQSAPGVPPPFQGGGLRAARGSGGSRYFNPLVTSGNANTPDVPVPVPVPPTVSMPSSFGFIPSMPDNADSVDPFSGESNPTVHGTDESANATN